MKILVAVDDSKFSQAVLQEVSARSWSPHTEILVLSVMSVPRSAHWQDLGWQIAPEIKEEIRKEAEALVQKSVQLLKERLHTDIPVESKVVDGHTCDAIAKAASEWKADVIMMGSHGRTGIGKFLLGSTAEGVLLRAPCSVEIIKSRARTRRQSKPKKKVTVLY